MSFPFLYCNSRLYFWRQSSIHLKHCGAASVVFEDGFQWYVYRYSTVLTFEQFSRENNSQKHYLHFTLFCLVLVLW
jgi:hypothetical protein